MQGTLLIVGGREEKQGEREILRHFTKLAGGDCARLLIVSTASDESQALGAEYEQLFSELGAEATALPVESRRTAATPAVLEQLQAATGLYFTGGDQLKLTSILGGTPFHEQLLADYQHRGLVVAGTSAGASALSDVMVVGGADEAAPALGTIAMAPGLGLLRGLVIDQHFAQRGRIGRLLSALAQNPAYLGVGIDENTVLVVTPSGRGRVLGEGAVTVLDGRQISHCNPSEVAPDEPLALTRVLLHVLPGGYGYDLLRREPLGPANSGSLKERN